MLHTPALSCEIRTDIKFNVISRIYCYENCSIHNNVFIKKELLNVIMEVGSNKKIFMASQRIQTKFN